MPETLVELAKELTLALIQTGNVASEDMQDTLQSTYATLTALKAQEVSGASGTVLIAETTPTDWRKSITRNAVICLECGQAFRQLSIRHLEMHELDVRSYRTKYGIPRTQPLAARVTTERRRQVAREIRPWEKAPRFVQAQKRTGRPLPEPDAETLPKETEEPGTAAPAQQTAPKKKAARKKKSVA